MSRIPASTRSGWWRRAIVRRATSFLLIPALLTASCAASAHRHRRPEPARAEPTRPEPKHTDEIVRVVPAKDEGITLDDVLVGAFLVCTGLEVLELFEAAEVATVAGAEAEMTAAEIGEYGETQLARQVGGRSQVRIGTRIYDQVASETAYEAKTGYKLLTPAIRTQVLKDAGRDVEWHFYPSPATGLRGPSPELAELLRRSGVQWFVH